MEGDSAAEQEWKRPEEIHTRLRSLNEFKSRINWVGGGGGVLLALLALGSDCPTGAARFLSSLVVTLVVIAGGLLAYARVNFEWAVARIENALKLYPNLKETYVVDRLPEDARDWPQGANNAWLWAFVLIILAGILFLAGTWWWLPDPLLEWAKERASAAPPGTWQVAAMVGSLAGWALLVHYFVR